MTDDWAGECNTLTSEFFPETVLEAFGLHPMLTLQLDQGDEVHTPCGHMTVM